MWRLLVDGISVTQEKREARGRRGEGFVGGDVHGNAVLTEKGLVAACLSLSLSPCDERALELVSGWSVCGGSGGVRRPEGDREREKISFDGSSINGLVAPAASEAISLQSLPLCAATAGFAASAAVY